MDEVKPGGRTSLDLRTAKSEPTVETTAVALPSEGRLTRGTPLFSWEAPEYIVYEKSTAWYVGFGIILALLLFSAFLLKSFLSGVVFGLAGLLVFLYSERSPRIIHYELRDTGIRIGDRIYPFRELSAFNMVERCLLYTSPSPRDRQKSRMPSSA